MDVPDRDRMVFRGPMKPMLDEVMRRYPYRVRGA
jgi:hypothetical protein